jgi:hypothetical protein
VNSFDRFFYERCRNFTYVDANTFTATTTNPVNTSGSLLTVTDPNRNWPAASFTIPANTMGKNGSITTKAFLSQNGSANAKHISTIWGPDTLFQNETNAFQVVSHSVSGSNLYNSSDLVLQNQNNAAKQVLKEPMLLNGQIFASGGRPRRFTRDTTQDQRITFGIRLANSSDWAILEYSSVEVFSKD